MVSQRGRDWVGLIGVVFLIIAVCIGIAAMGITP